MPVTETYTSSEYSISNGSTTAHTTLSDITMGVVFVRWKGVSWKSSPISATRTAYGTEQTCSSCSSIYSSACVHPTLNPAETFVSLTCKVNVHNTSGAVWYCLQCNRCNAAKRVIDFGGALRNIDAGDTKYETFWLTSSDCGTTNYGEAVIESSSSVGCSMESTLRYVYQEETKTGATSCTCNAQTASNAGPISNGYWTSWIAAPTGFIVEGANTISHTVAGSGSAKFQFKYDYIRNVPTATGYLKFRGKGQTYSVRIADPADSSLDYTCVRIYDDAIRCLDVVATTDPEASPLRIYTSKHGTLAFRKVV